MNKQIRSRVIALGMCLSLPALLFANTHKDMSSAAREKKLNKMASELSLSQEQKDKVRDIKNEKWRKVEDAKNEANNKIREVLNSDQQMKYDRMVADKD